MNATQRERERERETCDKVLKPFGSNEFLFLTKLQQVSKMLTLGF